MLFNKCDYALLFNDGTTCLPDANFLKHAKCDVEDAILLMSQNSKLLISSKFGEKEARKNCCLPLKVVSSRKETNSFLQKKLRGKKLGLDFSSISATRYLRIKNLLKKEPLDIGAELSLERAIKTPGEIKLISEAVKISKEILDGVSLSPAKSEIAVANELKVQCAKLGLEPAYGIIVAAGKNSSSPHHVPTSKKLGNSSVLIDFGVRYNNYCADLTRCFFLGKCEKEREKYEEAKQIFDSLVLSLPKCKTACDFANLAQNEIKCAGWPNLPHTIGHGIGLEVHEEPFFHSDSKTPLAPNTIIALEPAYYCKNFGVRYEDDLVITKNGVKIF